MFVIISHMSFSGAFSATETYITSTLEQARSKCIDILKEHYDEYCKEYNEVDFEVVNISENDKSILMMNYDEAYTYKGEYGQILTISKAN